MASLTQKLMPHRSWKNSLYEFKRLEFRTRRHAKLKWNLGMGVSLGVSLYTFYREASILPKEPLYRATNEPVRSVKQTHDQATGQLLLPSDVVNYVTVAGKDIVFASEEKEMMYKLEEPELTLLGFEPLTSAKEDLHFGPSSFAYAEETLIKGSNDLMSDAVYRQTEGGTVPHDLTIQSRHKICVPFSP
ncbi:X-ray repair cross-complementing protein 6-like [Homalodisca vitripennis]|uniref:X-ray repair cross-complementing protein 6-like n=1 Tax=Homalodisca vitripennis TaxID=197043 RepID=UPI001EEC5440|nr:X-ray repair cross-complementing protein 6-like [Homalodisca vitripennis]